MTLQPSLVAFLVLLIDKETQSILKHALDNVDKLNMNLKAQQDILNARLVKVSILVSHLQQVNQKKERKTDEV